MSFLKLHSQRILDQDSILANPKVPIYQLPRPVKATISLILPAGGTGGDEQLLLTILGLECLGGQKPYLNQRWDSHSPKVWGATLTLRQGRLYSFLDRLIVEVLPRVKQFDGFSLGNRSNVVSFTLRDLSSFEELVPIFSSGDNYRYLNCQIFFRGGGIPEMEFSSHGALLPIKRV